MWYELNDCSFFFFSNFFIGDGMWNCISKYGSREAYINHSTFVFWQPFLETCPIFPFRAWSVDHFHVLSTVTCTSRPQSLPRPVYTVTSTFCTWSLPRPIHGHVHVSSTVPSTSRLYSHFHVLYTVTSTTPSTIISMSRPLSLLYSLQHRI